MSYYSSNDDKHVSRFFEQELEEAIMTGACMLWLERQQRESDISCWELARPWSSIHAALYALATFGGPEPVSVVSSTPYYSVRLFSFYQLYYYFEPNVLLDDII